MIYMHGIDHETLPWVWRLSVLLGYWPCKTEMTPCICPSVSCVLFSTQPLSVNDEQSERCTKDDSTVPTTAFLPHGGFKSFEGARFHQDSVYFIPVPEAQSGSCRCLKHRSDCTPSVRSARTTRALHAHIK